MDFAQLRAIQPMPVEGDLLFAVSAADAETDPHT